MLVTGKLGNDLQVLRAQGGTVAAAHTAPASVIAFNTFTVIRGEDGTNAATHAINDSAVQPFKIRIGGEILRVTGITGNNLTVTRGVDGTAAAAHLIKDAVVHPDSFDNLSITRDIPVVVNPVNDLPTLDDIKPNPLAPGFLTIPEGSGEQVISLSGISDGEGAGARQHLRIEAVSSNLALTGPITYVYTDGNPAGSIKFTPTPGVSGSAGITVTVFDGGSDNNLNTLEADLSDKFSKVLNVTVVPIGDTPTINAISNLIIGEDGSSALSANISIAQTTIGVVNGSLFPKAVTATPSTYFTVQVDSELMRVTNVSGNTLTVTRGFGSTSPATHNINALVVPAFSLTGISDGDANTQQLRVTASTTDTNLISNLTLNYNPSNLQPPSVPPTTGTLSFVPGADQFGTASITVTVTDGGADTRLGIDTISSGILLADVPAVFTVANPARFPSAPGFNVRIDSEELTVTAIVGNQFTATRAQNGTVAGAHSSGADISAPDTVADNVSSSRTFTVTVNQVNDAPSVVAPPATITIPESSPTQTINLTGIDAGPFESQAMKVEVVSSNPALIPNPTVNFTPPTPGIPGSGSAVITYQPTAFLFGTATLLVKITDAGLDGLLGTNTDNGVIIKNIAIVVTRVDDAPTLNAVSPVTVNEESGQKSVALSGITAGGGATPSQGAETQILKVTQALQVESIAGLITGLSVDYASPNTTGTLKFTPGAGLFGTATVRVNVEDAGIDGVMTDNPSTVANEAADNKTFFQDITVNVANVEDAPVFTVPTNATVNKSNYLNLPVNLTGVYDGDLNSQGVTLSFVSSDPSFVAAPANVVLPAQVTPSTTTQGVTLHFDPAANQTGDVTITVTANDGVSPPVSQDFVLHVVDANLPPTIDQPAAISLNEDVDATTQTILLSGITAGGVETQGLKITAVSSDPNAIVIDNNTDIFYSSPDLTGAVDFHPQLNAAGDFTITITVTDDGGDGIFGNSNDNSTSTTVNVHIEPGNNDDPTLAAIADTVIAKSGSPTLQTVNLTGISAGPYESANVTVSVSVLSDPNGIINGLTVTAPALPGSTSTDSVTFTPTANQTGTAQIQVTVDDGVSTPFSRTFLVYVVNPPTIDSLSNPASVLEDTVSPPTINITGLGDGDSGTQGGTLTVTSSNQALISDANLVLSNTSLLVGTSTLSYTLNPDANGTTLITLTATDNGPDGVAGGGDDASFSTSFTITVTADNDAPTLTVPTTLTLTEDDLSNVAGRTINITNVFAKAGLLLDEANQPLRITASSADLSKLTVSSVSYTSPNSSGSVVVTPVLNAFTDLLSPVNVTITVEDGGTDNNLFTLGDNKMTSQIVSVSITPVNDEPTLNVIGDVTVDEDFGGTVNLEGITAGPGESQTLSVTVTSDNQDLIPDDHLTVDYMSANPTGLLSFTPLDNKSGDAFITVTVTDDNSIDTVAKSFSRTFKIHVNPVNDAPVITGLSAVGDTMVSGFTATINENLPLGTEVAAVDFDDEGPLSVTNVSIIAGNTDGAFSIDSAGTIKVAEASAIDFEKNPTFTLTVRIVDNSPIAPAVAPVTQDVTISLTDLTEVLTVGSANWTSGALTIRNEADGKVHVRNSLNLTQDVVPAHDIGSLSMIQVTGRSGSADVLTLDYTDGDPVPVGATGGLTFDGGTGVGDTFLFASTAFNQLNTTFASSTAATIVDPADLFGSVSLQGIEGIAFGSTVTATNLKFVYGSGADTVTVVDDGLVNGVSSFSAGSSPTVTFPAAAGLTIDLGDGDNSVTLNSIEDSAGPAVTVLGGTGSDVMYALAGGRKVSFSGGAGSDVLFGGSGADTLLGGDNDDFLSGGEGSDSLDGGSGTNTLTETSDTDYSVGNGLTSGGIGSDSFVNIQFAQLRGGSNANAISAAEFTGSATIIGEAGDDTLTGSSQADFFDGDNGDDEIHGGDGIDTLYEFANVNFTLGVSTLIGLGSDTFDSIELAMLTGGVGNNTLDASSFLGSVTLLGGAGNDVLKGGIGDDALFGEAGADTFTGNGGTNTLDGGTEIDQVFASGDTNFTLTPTQLSSSLGTDNLVLNTIETAKLVGGAGNNTLNASTFTGKTTLQGGDGADTIIGGTSADSLDGGAGNDVLTGGTGNDMFVGGSGSDTILEANVTTLSLTATSMTGRGNDVLTGMESASLSGTSGADTISGGSFAGAMTIAGSGGADSLTGGKGNDSILGGDGNDTMKGGGGNDILRGEANDDLIYGGLGDASSDSTLGNDSIDGGSGKDVI
ncbi:MAG: repeat-containing protein [Planctomycetota bacterium]|nr:MAG: repeat-containing protein [Planctomycetota bacterium]